MGKNWAFFFIVSYNKKQKMNAVSEYNKSKKNSWVPGQRILNKFQSFICMHSQKKGVCTCNKMTGFLQSMVNEALIGKDKSK